MVQKLALKTALKEARTTVKEATTKFKTAMEHGELSAEEAKDKALEVVDLAMKLEDIAEDIALGVPADPETPETPEDPETPEIPETPVNPEDPEMPDKVQTARQDSSHLEQDKRIAQLEKDNKEMKEAQMKQDLSLKYAQLFPEPMRVAQRKAFMSHKESPRILQARLDEATTLLSKQTTSHYKQAQITTSPFTFDDTNIDPDNTGVDLGSII